MIFSIIVTYTSHMTGDIPKSPLDEPDFKAIFDTYMPRVHTFIAMLCKSEHLAEDITQEVFIILWRKRNDLHLVRQMDQYIFRIARNQAIRLLKKAASDNQLAAHLFKASLQGSDEVFEEINRRSAQDLITQAILKLPPQPRKIYLLSRHEHMNSDEIATATGLSRHTVKNHLQKALTTIRVHLTKNGYKLLIAAIADRFLH